MEMLVKHPPKFKYVPTTNRRYVLGKDLKDGDRVWWRSSGRHYDFLGEVKYGVIIILPHHGTPSFYYGKLWALWKDRRYLLDQTNV